MEDTLKKQIELYDNLYACSELSVKYDEYQDKMFFKIVNDEYFFPRLYLEKLSDKIVLDIGSGGGNVGRKICNVAGKLISSDISFNALVYARERIKHSGSGYLQANMLMLPIKSDTVDIITCYTSMHHVEDLSPLAREAKRVLKKGGIFLGIEPAVRYNWIDFWMDAVLIPKRLRIGPKQVYLKLQKKFAKKDQAHLLFKNISNDSSSRHYMKSASYYREVFVRNGFSEVKVRTVLIEFLPPRLLESKSTLLVGVIFRISSLFQYMGIGLNKGKFILIEASN